MWFGHTGRYLKWGNVKLKIESRSDLRACHALLPKAERMELIANFIKKNKKQNKLTLDLTLTSGDKFYCFLF